LLDRPKQKFVAFKPTNRRVPAVERPNQKVLALALVLTGASSGLHASDISTDTLMQRMYLKLCDVINGQKPDPNLIFSLANPGLPIPSKGLDPAKDEDMVFLQRTLDTIPTPTAMYGASLNTYTSVYDRIMREKQVKRVPMSEAETAELAALQTRLKEDSPEMTKYIEYRRVWEEARMVMDEAEGVAKVSGKHVSDILKTRVGNNLEAWVANGFKVQIEEAQERYGELGNKSGEVWWNELNRRFQKINSPSTLHAVTFPKPQDWGKGGTWTRFTFNAADSFDSSSFSHKDVETSASISGGGVHVDVSAGWSKTEEAAAADYSDTTISFDLRRVAVYRPWLEGSIFTNPTWNLTGSLISNGAALKDLQGEMPLMLNQIVLCKNLKITGSWIKAVSASMEKNIHAHFHASFLFFSVSGGYSKTDTSSSSSVSSDGNSISCPGIQVIGFISTVVPKSPCFVP
jgi:hypothetical protein